MVRPGRIPRFIFHEQEKKGACSPTFKGRAVKKTGERGLQPLKPSAQYGAHTSSGELCQHPGHSSPGSKPHLALVPGSIRAALLDQFGGAMGVRDTSMSIL